MRTDFHQLTVKRVEPLTEDSAAITFTVPPDLAGAFTFAAGQTLTVRHGDERRTYSICAPAGAAPRIGVREVPSGAVSGWLVHDLKAGDTLEVGLRRLEQPHPDERVVVLARGRGDLDQVPGLLDPLAVAVQRAVHDHATILSPDRPAWRSPARRVA